MVFRDRGYGVEHHSGIHSSTSAPPSGTRHAPSSALVADRCRLDDGTLAISRAYYRADGLGRGGLMGGTVELELDYIRGMVEAIREYWDFVKSPYHPLGFSPAPFYHRWLEQHFGDGWLADESERQRCEEQAGRGLEIALFIPMLEGMSFGAECEVDDADFMNVSLRKHSAWSAYRLAKKAIAEPLDDAELNELGWRLTELVARGDDTLRRALREAARKAGRKGGTHSAATRRSDFVTAAAKTCELARDIQRERARKPADLVSVIAARLSLSKPTVRAHLRQGGLYPDEKKRKRG